MKHCWLFLLLIVLLGGCNQAEQKPATGKIIKEEADSLSGFNWPYYYYLPKSIDSTNSDSLYLYVGPNASPGGNDTFAFHDLHARRTLERMIPIAEQLNTAILVPVFPRSYTQWQLYTHALNRAVMQLQEGDLQRPDLQLIAMIDNLRKKLSTSGVQTHSKVLMEGFSASGMFTNRFCIMHPEKIRAASVGAPGGFPLLPVKTLGQTPLRYPIGIADLDSITGQLFNREAFQKIKMRIYIGADDENDSVPYEDSFEKQDGRLIAELFGKDIIARFRNCESVYRNAGFTNCSFQFYPGIGHAISNEMIKDNIAFYKAAMRIVEN